MSEQHHKNHQNGAGFEKEDLGSKPIIAFIVSVVVCGVLIYYVLWGVFHALDAFNRKHEDPVSPMAQTEVETRTVEPSQIKQFPEPRLEDNERTELNDFRYQEEEHLNSYGWVDQNAGVAHIPIDRAMQLIAERGLPTNPRTGTVPASPVNLAKQAAAKSDTSGMPAATAPKGKKGKQQ